jgi:hemerythrin
MPTQDQRYPPTGFARIDSDHLEIGDAIGKLVEAVNEGKGREVPALLAATIDLVSAHFTHEERLMAESGYTLLDRHRQAHEGFSRDLEKFAKDLAAKGLTPAFRGWVLGRLREWFRYHVVANDVALGQFLAARDAAARGAPGAEAGAASGKPA